MMCYLYFLLIRRQFDVVVRLCVFLITSRRILAINSRIVCSTKKVID